MLQGARLVPRPSLGSGIEAKTGGKGRPGPYSQAARSVVARVAAAPTAKHGWNGPAPPTPRVPSWLAGPSWLREPVDEPLQALPQGLDDSGFAQGLAEAEAEGLLNGTVKKWFEDRGFGFIMPDCDENQVFVHRSVLQDGRSLEEGAPVMFDLTFDASRQRFTATKVIGAVPSPPGAEHNEGDQEISGGKGGKAAKGGVRSSVFDDPWEQLYTEASKHLRSHLDGGAAPEDVEVKKPKGVGRGKGKDRAPRAVLTPKPSELTESTAATEPKQADTPSKEKADVKGEEPKATSIYDFFLDDGVDMES
mmetsp:Transcript_61704/g.133687  ORF Transcript_61704/g.133687 Transcript_61704/m.133687 type:complete len:306 (+) Transcript_61704:195-1112(+)|eukprot:CAMPEP_0170607288 /NCGR_PEP_ID=MMETSP0224-20130122/20972_1 /TAXON_ID=285029 /ORGANISM="Togula jolla, Strain CCCM 725" /LENGTH=305 /DNA_ID=CAMNT_0010932439 /DNA_START=190 /DNA_END=1107 /DNA_ORIENTATION=-